MIVVGTKAAIEGCYCDSGASKNYWTLKAGQYEEVTGYDSGIDYTDTSLGCLNKQQIRVQKRF